MVHFKRKSCWKKCKDLEELKARIINACHNIPLSIIRNLVIGWQKRVEKVKEIGGNRLEQ